MNIQVKKMTVDEKTDILITDPCYIIRDGQDGYDKGITDDDWYRCDYGSDMESLGIKDYINSMTGIGDGSWKVYKTDGDPDAALEKIRELEDNESLGDEKWDKIAEYLETFEDIGSYGADAGETNVFTMPSLESYNPKVREWLESHFWCGALIPGFSGTIETRDVNGELHIIGKGNINFFTA